MTTALLDSPDVGVAAYVLEIPLAQIAPDPDQARDEGADDELAASIAANGFYRSKAIEVRVNPLPDATTQYMVVDGERRFRAALKAGLESVPVIVTEEAEQLGDRLLRQVVSNDGKRLKPMEEARTFKRIMDDKGWNIQQLAEHLGRSKSTVSDRLAMLEIPGDFLRYVEEGVLTAAAAPILRPLAALPDKARKRVVENLLAAWDWEDALRDARDTGKAIPLSGHGGLESMVKDSLAAELRWIDPKTPVDYKGKIVRVGSDDYALDASAYEAAAKKAETESPAAKAKKPAPSAAELKARADQKREQERNRIARAKEAAARELKKRQHRAFVEAVLAEVPDAIDGKWALFLVRLLVANVFNLEGDNLVDALGLPPVKAKAYNAAEKALIAHAEKLDAKGRIRLVLKLAAYSEQPCYNKEEDWTLQAAALLKIDPKKIKVEPPVFSPELSAKVESAKKRR